MESSKASRLSRREFMRKTVHLVLGSALATGLGACGGTPTPTPTKPPAPATKATEPPKPTPVPEVKEATIRLLAWGNPQEVKAREETIKAFEAAYPKIKVNFLHTPTDYLNKLNTMIAGGDPPDVMYIGNGDMWRYAEQGSLLPLSPLMERDKFDTSDIFAEVLKLYVVGGVQYGLPMDAPNQELFLNLDIFEQASVDLPPFDWKDTTWTWDNFLQKCLKLTQRDASGKVTKYGFRVETSLRGWWVWVAANGGKMFSDDNQKCLLDEPPAVEAFQFLADLIHVHKVSPTTEAATDMGGYDMILGGNLAMSVYWPALERFRQEMKGKWDVCPHPAGKAGKACAGGGTGHHISKVTKLPEQSWTFLKYMMSPDAVKLWTEYMGIVPPLKSIANTDVFRKPGKPPAHINVFTEGLAYLRPDPRHPKFPQVVNVVNQELDYLWTGKKKAQEVLADAVKKANEVIQQK